MKKESVESGSKIQDSTLSLRPAGGDEGVKE